MRNKISLMFIFIVLIYNKSLSQFNTVSFTSNHNSYSNSKIDTVKSISFTDTSQRVAISVSNLDSIITYSKIKKFYSPVNNLIITSKFGYRFHPILKKQILHAGIDIKANYVSVKSFASGYIDECNYNERVGFYIKINHGNGIVTSYCHLNKIYVQKNDFVNAGQIIAESGNTGMSTAPHLHFAIKLNGNFINPISVLNNIETLNFP